MAHDPPSSTQLISGVLLSRDYQYHLIAPSELSEFTHEHLNVVRVAQRMSVPSRAPFELVRWHLGMMYGDIKDVAKEKEDNEGEEEEEEKTINNTKMQKFKVNWAKWGRDEMGA